MQKQPGLVVILVCILLMSPSSLFALQDNDALTQKYEEILTPIIKKAMENWELPGLAIAVVDEGRPVFVHGFGTTQIGGGSAVNERTLFHMASVSKPFIATAIMILVEEGKIDLDASVSTYLPYFKLDDPRTDKVTIRGLLTHTSGMPDVSDYEWDNPQTDAGALERWVRSFSDRKLLFDPGTRHQYSNIGYEVLGDVIAKVSNMPLEDFLKKRIFEPAGMADSTFFYPETDKTLRTRANVTENGRLVVSDVYPYNRRHAASSTLNSNAVDMARWIMANINHGEIGGKRIIGAKTHAQMLVPASEEINQIGLSWFIRKAEDGSATYYHSGADHGFRSYCMFEPSRGFGVAVMTNCDYNIPSPLARVATAVSMGEEARVPLVPTYIYLAEKVYTEGGKAAASHWRELKKNDSGRYSFSAASLNFFGYYLMYRGLDEAAIEILKLQTEEFGDQSNPWDSLGEAYWKVGDIDNAKRCFSKALEINPESGASKQALAALNEGKTFDQR